MTEETKKPRRKRRTKAQIEADKAAKLAAKQEEERCIPCEESATAALEAAEAAMEEMEKEVEMNFGSSYEKEIDAISEEVAKEATVASVAPSIPKKEEYIPLTGLAKIRHKHAQRMLKDRER